MTLAMLDDAITAFVTLFVVIDPIGLAPLFLALTVGASAAQRRAIAVRGTLIAALVLAAFGLGGEALLEGVGISMSAFRISGGLLLFLTALDMLFERRNERRQKRTTEEPERDLHELAVFPLAIPLMAGPGAITSMILLVGEHEGNTAGQVMVFGVAAGVLLLAFASFFIADWVGRLLGRSGIIVVTRLFGMLLAALSVQFVLDGLSSFGLAGNPAG